MTRQDIIEKLNPEDEAILLDPPEEFDGGIVGITEDKCHIIYDYEETVASIASAYRKYSDTDGTEDVDYLIQATEWFEYNTIRAIPYMDKDYAPIIIISLNKKNEATKCRNTKLKLQKF